MRPMKWMMALAFSAPLVAMPAYADEGTNIDQQQLKMADLPDAVQTTVKREAQGNKVESIKKATEDGKTVYMVKLRSSDKQEQKLEISEDGNVLQRQPMQHAGSAFEQGEQNR